MVFDFDDFGANHVISDMCQSHDCRDLLDKLHYANNAFKVTLFTIPQEMTMELAEWCKANSGWVELAVHGFKHGSNYECEKMTYEEFDASMKVLEPMLSTYFVKGFKAPGWQISNAAFEWLHDNGWWVGDQSYNDTRRPKGLAAYVNHNGLFTGYPADEKKELREVEAWHGHCWNCVGNGIEETFDHVESLVKAANDFQFVSEVLA